MPYQISKGLVNFCSTYGVKSILDELNEKGRSHAHLKFSFIFVFCCTISLLGLNVDIIYLYAVKILNFLLKFYFKNFFLKVGVVHLRFF